MWGIVVAACSVSMGCWRDLVPTAVAVEKQCGVVDGLVHYHIVCPFTIRPSSLDVLVDSGSKSPARSYCKFVVPGPSSV